MNAKQIVMMMLNQNPRIKSNPMIKNALDMADRNDVKGLENLANNLAQSNGTSIDDVMAKLGVK